jgi:iodotyrosine deiodinase
VKTRSPIPTTPADAEAPTVPLEHERLGAKEMVHRASAFLEMIRRRRSVRDFSPEPIDLKVVRDCIAAAAQAPSGANKQPWTFILVSDPDRKRQIRLAAEEEERAFYTGRAPPSWLADLRPLGTTWEKPFLETAPVLILIFARRYGRAAEEKHYYVNESVGIAAGFLIAALHNVGLATLTHTPSPMTFLSRVLGRPDNERPFLLLPVGLPADGCRVPAIDRKPLSEVLVEIE